MGSTLKDIHPVIRNSVIPSQTNRTCSEVGGDDPVSHLWLRILIVAAVWILLMIPAVSYCGSQVFLFFTPTEIASPDDFNAVLFCAQRDKDNNRAIVVQYPAGLKIKAAFSINPATGERIELSAIDDVSSLFIAEKNKEIVAFYDNTDVSETGKGRILYYITFTSNVAVAKAEIKVCLVERSDPYVSPEPSPQPKGKKSKKSVKPKPRVTEWRMVNPAKGASFEFGATFSQNMTSEIRFVSGWTALSRSLKIDSLTSSVMMIDSNKLKNFFSSAFTLGWWQRSVSPNQRMFIAHAPTTNTSITFGLSDLGLPIVSSMQDGKEEVLLQINRVAFSGEWHHYIVSGDGDGKLRYFVDGELVDSIEQTNAFNDVCSFSIGGFHGNDIQIDELLFYESEIVQNADAKFPSVVAVRDTMSGYLAAFHFEEHGAMARSSIAHRIQDTAGVKPRYATAKFNFEPPAAMKESSAPILLDNAVLTAEQTTPSKISFAWKAVREYNVKTYSLQRKISSFGEYQQVLKLDAKRPIRTKDEETDYIARASYSAVENLPQLTKDIDLYYRLALIGFDSSVRYTDPIKIEYGRQRAVFLEQNKPNPFNPKTTISFRLAKSSLLRLAVYDIMGREVVVLVDKKLSAGRHTVEIDATNWPAGIYFYKARIGKTTITKRMVLAK